MRNANGRLNAIENAVRAAKARAEGWRTAVQFDNSPIYLKPRIEPGQPLNYRSHLTEESCIADNLPIITEAEAERMENLIILHYVSDWRGS